MKKIAYLSFFALSLIACNDNSEVEMGMRTTLKVNAVYDAGKVAKGEVINAKFTVENTGDYALVLSDVKGSCSCTVADWSQDPIPPGEKGYIKATVNTESFSEGPVARKVSILANTKPPQTDVSVQATIIK